MFHEKHTRTIAKSITWRLVAFGATVIVLQLMINDWQTSLIHSVVIHAIKTILYYVHERLWNMSNFGQELKTK